ncbi:hypothetical protein MBM_09948 [Drepanopeziza brunnea f. sp. 'multigermtubi' MB_m1]|uniref:Uncharacterized protein n=1 Tax=Marssonina brunnea f. sp. multigermtubi (strain MB_m1) TaxID=1072389 RepID=K1XHB4_MARBU|nr:uncharacterized protein MBM_09948 [Drepanopeziza brunnea f. sp. 'multigermtubi' MB_m1]EKD11869.1 hypothetical protein MBM_09948 [Drepanopeziza brunnea f. sp. 'multigermtubi' MB_m1]
MRDSGSGRRDSVRFGVLVDRVGEPQGFTSLPFVPSFGGMSTTEVHAVQAEQISIEQASAYAKLSMLAVLRPGWDRYTSSKPVNSPEPGVNTRNRTVATASLSRMAEAAGQVARSVEGCVDGLWATAPVEARNLTSRCRNMGCWSIPSELDPRPRPQGRGDNLRRHGRSISSRENQLSFLWRAEAEVEVGVDFEVECEVARGWHGETRKQLILVSRQTWCIGEAAVAIQRGFEKSRWSDKKKESRQRKEAQHSAHSWGPGQVATDYWPDTNPLLILSSYLSVQCLFGLLGAHGSRSPRSAGLSIWELAYFWSISCLSITVACDCTSPVSLPSIQLRERRQSVSSLPTVFPRATIPNGLGKILTLEESFFDSTDNLSWWPRAQFNHWRQHCQKWPSDKGTQAQRKSTSSRYSRHEISPGDKRSIRGVQSRSRRLEVSRSEQFTDNETIKIPIGRIYNICAKERPSDCKRPVGSVNVRYWRVA